MKAVRILQEGEIGLVELPVPNPEPGQVLLKIDYVGFCGSDLNTYLGKNPMVKYPVIPGHEIGASVVKVTNGVPNHIQEGMTCTVNPYTSCGNCASCRNGRANACKNNETLGVQRNGAMSEYIVLPWQKVIVLDSLNTKESALVEPMSVGFHAVSRGAVASTDFVLVIGCGMIGVGAIVGAALRGARVIAMDLDDNKLSLARQLGAEFTINSAVEDVHQALQEMTSGFGPDVVIEAVGAPATYQMAVNEVAFTGRVVYIGYAKSEIPFETKLFVQKEIDIRGSRNATPEDFDAVIDYLKKKTYPVDQLITKICKPEEAGIEMQNWVNNTGNTFRILVAF